MSSPITHFYANRCIFITGATGFIGKVLVEKLLFECEGIRKIFILLRPKRGQQTKQRLEEFIQCSYFKNCDRIKAEILQSKLEAIDGDITKPELGISADDRQKLIDHVSIVFHSAASVKFNDPLKECLNFNVLGTKSVMDLCKDLKHLKSFVHVSTAYAYCHLNQTEERVYEMEVSPDQMLELADSMDSDSMNTVFMNSSVAEGRPNTYTFTKALAEQYIRDNRGDLPVAIARPSIVTGAWKGAVPGWIDGSNGPTGLVILGALGIARTMDFNPSCTADLIPVDVVVNSLISIAWYTATTPATELRVYNISTGTQNPITWYDYLNFSRDEAVRAPSMKSIRPPANVVTGQGSSKASRFLTNILSEVLFAYMMDFILMLIGRKPMLVSVVKRMHQNSSLLNYFCKRSWSFPCDNLISLISHVRMTCPSESERFYMDVTSIEWREYISNCYMGGRRYLLREEDTTIPDARLRMRRIKLIYYSGLLAMLALVMYVLILPFNSFTGRSSSISNNMDTSNIMKSSLVMDLGS